MKPCPLLYNSAIVKKLVVFLRKVELCLLQLGLSKDEERLRGAGRFAKAGSFVKRAVASSPPSAWQRSPPVRQKSPSPSQDVLQVLTGNVGVFLPLAGMQQGRRTSWLREKLR